MQRPDSYDSATFGREKCGDGPGLLRRRSTLDRVRAQGAVFGCVLADAGYGNGAEFRRGLSERGLLWAVSILPTQKVYPADVELLAPVRTGRGGRPRKHPTPSEPSQPAEDVIAGLGEEAWTRVAWRRGRKRELAADFVALRVRVADGPLMAMGQHLPGDEAWLVAERRRTGSGSTTWRIAARAPL